MPTSNDPLQSIVSETSDETFDTDVLERSRSGPVVVDFWAEWCAPCRMLAPILEKVVAEFAGSVRLVKANTDVTSEAASRYGVAGIPAVFSFVDEAIVDSFQGVLPEADIRGWVERQVSRGDVLSIQSTLYDAEADEEQLQIAEQQLRALIAKLPNEAHLQIILAEYLLRNGRDKDCRAIIQELENRGFLEPQAERLKAQLELTSHAAIDIHTLHSEVERAPHDLSKQLELARALAGRAEYREACEMCLQLVSVDRLNTGELARLLMLDIFRVLPDESELTSEYRRKLSMVLY